MKRADRTAALAAVWYGGQPPSLAARAGAALFAALTAARRALYRAGVLRATQLPVPVIVVGNLTAGGAGKTPLVIALVEALRERGRRPGVVSRGHGASRSDPRLLDSGSTPADGGDEPVLIARATGVPVAVGHDRPAAARLLVDAGCDVVVADDGLQHYALARDIEICVIDGVRRFGNGRLLPAGPLREPLSRLDGVAWRVCNGGTAQPGEVAMTLVGDTLQRVASSASSGPGATPSVTPPDHLPLAAYAGQRVHAVAGIGNPERFFATLRAAGLDVLPHAFPDHHAFVATDIAFGDSLPVLMTAKDAIKCAAFAGANVWQLPVKASLAPGFFDAVVARSRP